MPKIVDYVARWGLFREAAFAIVLEQGVSALSRRSLAKRLEVSPATIHRTVASEADLVTLAADEVDTRRRRAIRWPLRDESPQRRALRTAANLVPDTAALAEAELVWLRLELATDPSRELTELVARHRAGQTATLESVAELLDVPWPRRPAMVTDLGVVVDGLTWAVCTGRIEPTEALPALARALDVPIHPADHPADRPGG